MYKSHKTEHKMTAIFVTLSHFWKIYVKQKLLIFAYDKTSDMSWLCAVILYLCEHIS